MVPFRSRPALRNAADHIPVVLEPAGAREDERAPSFALGDAIVGATLALPLTVANRAPRPPDTLRYYR